MRSLTLSLLLAGAAFAGDGDVALQAGTIHLSATETLEDGTILVRGGKIVADGTPAEVAAGDGLTGRYLIRILLKKQAHEPVHGHVALVGAFVPLVAARAASRSAPTSLPPSSRTSCGQP